MNVEAAAVFLKINDLLIFLVTVSFLTAIILTLNQSGWVLRVSLFLCFCLLHVSKTFFHNTQFGNLAPYDVKKGTNNHLALAVFAGLSCFFLLIFFYTFEIINQARLLIAGIIQDL